MGTEQAARKPRKRLKRMENIAIALMALLVALQVIRMVGVRLYVMASPDMGDALSVGDLLVVVPKGFDGIAPGDIITFTANEAGQTETYRVVSKDDAAQTFAAKGDLPEADGERTVAFGDVVGAVCVSVPGVGDFFLFSATPQGKILLGLLFAIFVDAVLLISLRRKNKAAQRGGKHGAGAKAKQNIR